MTQIEESELLDWGVRIGTQACLDNVEKHQLENLIASLESTVDEKYSFWVTAVFALRQATRQSRGRPLISPSTADLVFSAMNELSKKSANREQARKMLGFAKWVYEISNNIKKEALKSLKGIKSLKDFIEFLEKVEKTGIVNA